MNLQTLMVVMVFAPIAIPTLAAEVWTGPTVTFSKDGSDDPSLEENQDVLTENVRITRGDRGGIYNPVSENGFSQAVSPAGTEWAFAGLLGNPSGAAFSAQICANTMPSPCNFTNWHNAQIPGSEGANLVPSIPAVLHLISEDIYIDLTFTEWRTRRTNPAGALVTYQRTTPAPVAPPSVTAIPVPPWSLLCLLTLLAIVGRIVIGRSRK